MISLGLVRRVLLLLLAASAIAHAEDRDTASIHFQAAEAAIKRSDWQIAIDEYERAYQLAPHPSVLFNLAEPYEALAKFRKAAELLTEFLAKTPNANDRAAIEARIEKLRDRPSQVTVKFPPGATLFVDGAARGEIPVELELPAGTHKFHVERDADASRDQEIALAYGEPAEPAFELEHAPPVTPSGRRPPTLTLGVGLGVLPGLGSAWDSGVAVAWSGRLGGSFALTERLRVIFDLGIATTSIEDERIGIDLGPAERYVIVQPRGGFSFELWRKAALHLDVFGVAGLVLGYHSLSFGMETVSRQSIGGAGAGGGITFFGSSESSPRSSYFISAGVFLLPTGVGDDTGYRSQGTVDLGGFEVALGYSILLGPLATKPVSR